MESLHQEPQSVDLFSPEMERLFAHGTTYSRKREPLRGARQVSEDTVVETHLPDGEIESTRKAKPGDWVVTGSEGEEFVFSDSRFHSLYEEVEGKYIPHERTIVAIQNPFKMNVRISAPWGTPENPEFEDGEDRCVFVVELSSDGTLTKERYIIGNEELLLNNYTPAE